MSIRIRIFISLARPTKKYPLYAKQMMYPKILLNAILAENGVGIFAISTFNTDYILVKAENFEKALKVLSDAGYDVV